MEYVSQKTVTILERRLGLMHLFFFVLIMGYMVGVRLILERGYLAVELSHGFVSATLEGNTYSMGGGQSYAVDSPELIGPQLESNQQPESKCFNQCPPLESMASFNLITDQWASITAGESHLFVARPRQRK